MSTQSLRSFYSRCMSWTPPIQYSILVTATLLPKLLHLYTHITSLPCLLTLLYLPTFLALDVANAAVFWVIVHTVVRGRTSILLGGIRLLFILIVVGASSIQIVFYFETGGEIKWGTASNFAHDPAGFKLLLSGGLQVVVVAFFTTLVSAVISKPLYHRVKSLMLHLAKPFSSRCTKLSRESEAESKVQLMDNASTKIGLDPNSMASRDDVGFAIGELKSLEAAATSAVSQRAQKIRLLLCRAVRLAPIITVLILLTVRPRTFPYGHMSNSLPFTLLDLWSPHSQNMCQAGGSREFPPFPLPELISSKFWEAPDGLFVGWMPTVNSTVEITDQRNKNPPSWLPREPVPGFDRWYTHGPDSGAKHHNKYQGRVVTYDPVKDPLRISNLAGDLLTPISEAIKASNVTIKHMVIISLESTRKDVFPLKKGSHIHNVIMKTHGSKASAADINSQLARLTVNAELLTGESSGFEHKNEPRPVGSRNWRNLNKENGGLNVVGAFTGSTSTFKSMLGSHCGVQPLPVDFTVEADGHIYQPCLPSILELFNRNKETFSENERSSQHSEEDFKSRPWKSVFVQSITDQYDRQDDLNREIGFSKVITKETLLDPASKHYPPTEMESNYFGFPETQVKEYLRDTFRAAEENNERLFLSHFTSSTHHPWNTPKAAGEPVDYLMKKRWRSEHPLNRYLNTVKYDDGWIGEIMDMLDEHKIADQTLVVLVGDHGYAFEEDSNMHSTFENGHISNLRVPLVFYHPSLPRIQLAINATSLSILPTILDLLTATSSLSTQDVNIASNLIQQYEGQSLIRPFLNKKGDRQQWNIGVLNAGGAMISVSSAAVPFRLTLPICKLGSYRFTNTDKDPNEIFPIEANSVSALVKSLRRKHGDEAASEWVVEAEKIGKWWVLEQRQRWSFGGASLQADRTAEEMKDMGKEKGRHWWET